MSGVPRTAVITLLLAFSPWAQAIDNDRQQVFEQLLLESGLQIETPVDFNGTPVLSNPVLPYEHALRHESGALEMRFIIRPLSRITIDYSDPHNAAPEPEHLFPLLFESITNRLSMGSDSPTSTFPEAIAESSFNANWAAAAVLSINPEFAAGYQNGLLIAMHRNHVADAYTLFLYNDHEQAKPLINNLLSVMSFTPEAQQ
jgi:hypothetical protein